MLLTLSLLWGGSYLSARVAAPVLPPFTLVFLRCALAAVALLVILKASGARLGWTRRQVIDYAGMGLLNNVIPFALIFYGTSQIGAGLASILNATTPIFTALVAHAFTSDEKLTANKTVGVILGFVGVAEMLGLGALADLGGHLEAELACLAAAVSYAVSTLWGRRFRGQPPMATAAGQLSLSSLIVLPLMLAAEAPWTLPMPPGDVAAAVLFLAFGATALAYILFFRILTLAGSNVMLVTFLVPVSAILLGVLVLGETLQLRHWVGMGLIMAGLVAIDGRLWRQVSRRFAGA
nr:DMT family transporter [Chthonobacter rhizosphaerae]